ncbi:MAG: hypothetical protein LBR55_02415, partial [Bacteroidales bacterium]|nr:hypothetical protein [Bacteroidales bacterium]
MKSFIFILCFFCSTQHLCAQQDTTFFLYNTTGVDVSATHTTSFAKSPKSSKIRPYILPTVLISYGIVTQFIAPLQNFDHRIDANIHTQKTYKFDDYILFAPYVALYALDWCG